MDARAEAEKRHKALNPDDELLTYPRSALREHRRDAFIAGAAWALREFGGLIEAEVHGNAAADRWTPTRDLPLLSWASEAWHIADGIEDA